MASKRALDISVESAIANFHSKSKLGPDFVCPCCHRMMYRVLLLVIETSTPRIVLKQQPACCTKLFYDIMMTNVKAIVYLAA